MKFSTKSTYGLRALVELTRKWPENISLATVAKTEDISLRYLEQIFAKLKKAGIVKADKGASGGYSLTAAPEKIKIYDVIAALEGEMSVFHCVDEKGKVYCSKKCKCGVTNVLDKVQSAINSTLKNIKLSELIE